MKRFSYIFLIVLGTFSLTTLQAQSPALQTQLIEDVEHSGYHIDVERNLSQVKLLWLQHTRNFGRAKKEEGYFIISNPRINGATYLGLKLYTQLQENNNSTRLWFGTDKLNNNPKQTIVIQHVLQETLKDFAYKSQIGTAVKESNIPTVSSASKTHYTADESKNRSVDSTIQKSNLTTSSKIINNQINTTEQKLVQRSSSPEASYNSVEKHSASPVKHSSEEDIEE